MPGAWRPLLLYAVRAFADMRVSRVVAINGAFPPPSGELVLEQSAVGVLHADVGSSLRIRVPGRDATVRIAGLVQDPAQAPGWQDHDGYAYLSPETLASLGVGEQLDEIRIRATADRTAASRIADAVASTLRDNGHDVRLIGPVNAEAAAHTMIASMHTVALLRTMFDEEHGGHHSRQLDGLVDVMWSGLAPRE